jgi:hypothetical protein
LSDDFAAGFLGVIFFSAILIFTPPRVLAP